MDPYVFYLLQHIMNRTLKSTLKICKWEILHFAWTTKFLWEFPKDEVKWIYMVSELSEYYLNFYPNFESYYLKGRFICLNCVFKKDQARSKRGLVTPKHSCSIFICCLSYTKLFYGIVQAKKATPISKKCVKQTNKRSVCYLALFQTD